MQLKMPTVEDLKSCNSSKKLEGLRVRLSGAKAVRGYYYGLAELSARTALAVPSLEGLSAIFHSAVGPAPVAEGRRRLGYGHSPSVPHPPTATSVGQ